MNDNVKGTLNAQERKRLIETTAVVHQVIKEISDKKPQTIREAILKCLKHPLLLVLCGSFLSGIFIFEYQNYYTRSSAQIKAKYELMSDISLYIGKVLAWADNVAYLHRKPIIDTKQIIETNQSFNEALDQYNSNYLSVAFQLKIVFKNKEIDEQWKLIHKKTKGLTVRLEHMGKFKTDKQHLKHAKRIDECLNKIEEIKTNLDKLSGFMVKTIK